jgi:hypothetical protein
VQGDEGERSKQARDQRESYVPSQSKKQSKQRRSHVCAEIEVVIVANSSSETVRKIENAGAQ